MISIIGTWCSLLKKCKRETQRMARIFSRIIVSQAVAVSGISQREPNRQNPGHFLDFPMYLA